NEMNVHRISITCVGVSAQQQLLSTVSQPPRIGEVLVEGHYATVRPTHAALRYAGPRYAGDLETRVFDQSRSVTIIDARLNEDFGRIHQFLEATAFACHGLPLRRNWSRVRAYKMRLPISMARHSRV